MNNEKRITVTKNNRPSDIFFYLFEIITGFKMTILFSCLVSILLSYTVYIYFSQSYKTLSVEIYKDSMFESYNTIDSGIIYGSFLNSLKDFKIYKEVFKPYDFAVSVHRNSNFDNRTNEFSLVIDDKFINEKNKDLLKTLIEKVSIQTIEKSLRMLDRIYENKKYEKEAIFSESNILNLEDNYARIMIADSEIVAVVEKDFIRELLSLNVELKLMENDISLLRSERDINDFILINIDNVSEKLRLPSLAVYLFIGLILGFVVGIIIAIFQKDYSEYYVNSD